MARFWEDAEKDLPIYNFVEREKARDGNRRGSTTRAIAAAVKRFNKEDVRTIEKACARMRPQVQGLDKSVEYMRQVFREDDALFKAHFTADELTELDHVSLPMVRRIAEDRAELKRLRAEVERLRTKSRRTK
jgi:predicted  nucleic acid-binding Zn-ribbon protein